MRTARAREARPLRRPTHVSASEAAGRDRLSPLVGPGRSPRLGHSRRPPPEPRGWFEWPDRGGRGSSVQPTLRRAWPRDQPEAAMCVQGVDVQCVLQFTLIHAASCALHRRASRVIHCPKLFSCLSLETAIVSKRIGKKEGQKESDGKESGPRSGARLEHAAPSAASRHPLAMAWHGGVSSVGTRHQGREKKRGGARPPRGTRPPAAPRTLSPPTPGGPRKRGADAGAKPRRERAARATRGEGAPAPRLPQTFFFYAKRIIIIVVRPSDRRGNNNNNNGNDPSAGSPTETLLRLLLSPSDRVRASSRRAGAGARTPGRDRSDALTEPLNR